MENMEIITFIDRIRSENKISKKDFAAKCGISVQSYHLILKGRTQPSLKTVCLMLSVLDYSLMIVLRNLLK